MKKYNVLETLFSLKGKRGIVTGSSSGLGLEMSRILAQAGAKVFALSRSGAIKVEYNTTFPETVEHLQVDVTDYSKIKNIVEKIGENGGIDFLVNNAGITVKDSADSFAMDTFEKIQKVNVEAVFHLCKICHPYLMKAKDSGRIVSISSMAAYLGFSEVVPYGISKSAINGLTRGLAVEWADDNILVNAVAPGWFPSEMNKQVMDKSRGEKILNRMPLHRFGKPEELAAMVLFLVSPASSYITGQDFAVDGGALAFGY